MWKRERRKCFNKPQVGEKLTTHQANMSCQVQRGVGAGVEQNVQFCETWKYVKRLNQVCWTRIRRSVALCYILRQSILFCWVAWCNMMCKVWTDDAGCDDHLWAASSCVINPSWGIAPILALVALEKSQSHRSASWTLYMWFSHPQDSIWFLCSCVINLFLRDRFHSGTGCTWQILQAYVCWL